jgi:uncharacterized protein YgbK (DUF1537 family)
MTDGMTSIRSSDIHASDMRPSDTPTPLMVWYGDDFTGATDTLATVALAGMRSVLFLGVPDAARLDKAGPLDAIGIAGAARSMTPDQMTEELRPVGAFFAQTGARVMHYKCCSTFDSAPTVGSIGVAVNVLRKYVGNAFVPVIGGQPNLGRYCAFANLYAKVGQQPEVYRIDRHPVMSRHPVTPMNEADLRIHLAEQGLSRIASLPHTFFTEHADQQHDEDTLHAWAHARVADNAEAVIVDVINERDLARAGALMWRLATEDTLLAVGPSSVAQALLRHWKAGQHHQGASPVFHAPEAAAPLLPASTPVFVFAGSLSSVSTQQIDSATCYRKHALDVVKFQHDPAYVSAVLQQVVADLRYGNHVLVYSDRNMQTQETASLAYNSARFVKAVLQEMADSGQALSRVGVAGGDTSSHVTEALGLWALGFSRVLAPGVTMSIAYSDTAHIQGLQIMLKGGQMGHATLFDDLVNGQLT